MVDKSDKSYHKLILWSKLKELLILTYNLTRKLPKTEEFALTPQMRRAMISVISNFVEGYLKSSKKDKHRFLEMSGTSLMELEAQSEACLILDYWTNGEYEEYDKKRALAGYFLYKYKSSLK